MDEILKPYELSDVTLKKVRELMVREMELGLSKENSKSSVKMLLSFVQNLPSRKEFGKFLALDLGGTNFRVLIIELRGSEAKMNSKIYPLSNEIKTTDGTTLFEYIVDCLEDFIEFIGDKSPMSLGFTFSFPVNQNGLASGTLVQWTKEIYCTGVVGNDVVLLLQQAINKRKNLPIKCVALVNDTVGCLMSCAFEDPDTSIGVIIGTGTNASYIEKIQNIKKWVPNTKEPLEDMIINMEWGGFGDNGCLDFLKTDVDEYIDDISVDKGKQRFEKMISGKYLGEIARLIILKCAKAGLIFGNERHLSAVLKTAYGFKTKYISDVESDSRKPYHNTKTVLTTVGMPDAKAEECEAVWMICRAVSIRSAGLVSAGVAAIVNKMGRPRVTVGVDGSLYRFHPHFGNNMLSMTQKLINPKIQVKMRLSEDGSGKGAAVIAAVAEKLEKH